MKGFCYIVLVIGFFLFFQKSPMYAIVIIGIFIGVYLFYKSRTSSGSGVLSFLSGSKNSQDTKVDDLITLMMVQQLMNTNHNSGNNNSTPQSKDEERIGKIEKTKQDILRSLEE